MRGTPALFAIPPVLQALRARLLAPAILARLSSTPRLEAAGPAGAPTSGEYLTIGPFSEVPADTMGAWGSTLSAAVKVVSYSRDVAPGYAVCADVIAALHGQPLAVAGYRTAWAQLELVADAYQELVAGAPVTHFPLIFRVHVHEAA
jgi:hypothetical protein